MPMRAFFLSVLVLAACAPSANAGVLDKIVPIHDASDGVVVTRTTEKVVFRFGPKAAKLYRGLAGQKATVACGHPEKDDGTTTGFVGTDGSFTSRAGMSWTNVRLPRKRGRFSVFLPGPADVCFISTKERRSDDACVPGTSGAERCVRLVVARTEQGRTDLDERLRAVELDALFDQPLAAVQEDVGDGVVALDSPDASPPPGTVGLFKNEQTSAAVALLRDGRRWYVRRDGDVFSTNVAAIGTSGHLDSLF